MNKKFSGVEVIEIGIQIEVNGRDFYRGLLESFTDPKTIEVFQYLANEEEKHISAFNKMLDTIENYESHEAYSEELFSYIHQLATQHVFTKENKGKELAQQIKDEKEAIQLGMKFEEDSIALFKEMKKVVPQDQQYLIEALISQEKNHLENLTALLAERS